MEYFLEDDGRAPFTEWLLNLRDRDAHARISARLNRVKLGNFGIIKALGDGVIELKIDYGPGYRVYYAMNGKTIVLLLIGGDKATQTKDIKVAKAYWGATTERIMDMARKTGNYDEYHLEWLKDPQNAAAFINAVIEDSDREAFLLALKDVVQAQGGMTAIAEKTHVSRSSLYKTLSKRGNPEFNSISKLLHSMGLRLTVEPAMNVVA